MAQAKKCDRCGTFYDIYNTANSEMESNGFMFLNIDTKGKYFTNGAYDLCPECNQQLHKWLKNSK